MKTRILNVGILDLRKATQEAMDRIDRIENVGAALVSPETRGLLTGLTVRNLGGMVEIPAQAKLSMQNGKGVLTRETLAGEIYLLVNGKMRVDADVDAALIEERFAGGIVNGVIMATKTQMGAMLAKGLHVNGKAVAIPDGAKLFEEDRITPALAGVMGCDAFCTSQAVLEPGVCRILADKGITLYGSHGVVAFEGDMAALSGVWKGEGGIVAVPDGYRLLDHNQVIGARDVLKLRGKRFALGRVILREDVTAATLAQLDGLHVRGALFAPESVLDALLPKLENEPELIPYEGKLMVADGELTLTRESLAGMAGKTFLFVDGVLTIDAEVESAALLEKLSLLYYDGVVILTRAQGAALAQAMLGDGTISYHEDARGEEDEEESADGEYSVIGNTAVYTL